MLMQNSSADRKWLFYIPAITSLVSLPLLLIAIYFGWLGPAAGHGSGFCEAEHDGLIKQPVNTWSNLGFVIAGWVIGYSQYRGRFMLNVNPFQQSYFSIFYAVLAVLLGPGSMAMHATTSQVGGFLDMFSMYMIASFLVAYASFRLLRLKVLGFNILFFALMVFCVIMHFQDFDPPFVGHPGSFVFGCLLIFSFILENIYVFGRSILIRKSWGFSSVMTMCLAFFIWNLSLSVSPWCDPSSLIQGHGIWHLLNALSVYFLYRYYVSETNA